MGRWNDFYFFKPSIPRSVRGGIKAQSRRGTFGESWWAKRWISVLESFNIGARLGRGRSYARNGQVLSIEIDKGKVTAKVQGSRPKPYNILIRIKTISPSDWRKLAQSLLHQAIFLAKLLAGEMPNDIEKVFEDLGLSLFPEKLKDLETKCSCPDWSNPCKHIAAAYYLLGEEFDRDPFLIFKLRGMSREDLLGSLGDIDAKKGKGRGRAKPAPFPSHEKAAPPAESLPADPVLFWEGGNLPEVFPGEVRVPPFPAALPKRLGSFPFWRGKERFLDAMETIYATASISGLNVVIGEKSKGD
ncbi:MAG: SWIM zinc finger family protein [Deltaproteobacteria bacterium]|nr:SWIM zinc finger family protein [Deltaproteobacteria bacterium]